MEFELPSDESILQAYMQNEGKCSCTCLWRAMIKIYRYYCRNVFIASCETNVAFLEDKITIMDEVLNT